MRFLTHTPALLVALALTSCGTLGASLGHRTGPDFRDAFPDPTVLVTTSDPAAIRRRLAEVQLPANYAHHDQLVAMLRSQEKLSAAHLQLLVEAVALPEGGTVFASGNRVRVYAPRGEGQFAAYADQLLTEGSARLVDLDLTALGELLARTQHDAAMQALAERFIPTLDDGSAGALQGLLGGLQGSPAAIPFLVDYMLVKGRLDGERGWAAVGMLPFDADRVALVRAIAGRVRSVDAPRIASLTKSMSFDEGRAQIVRTLAGKARPVPADIARAVVASFSFDEGRQAACMALVNQGDLRVDLPQLTAITALFSFDEGRTAAVRALVAHMKGEGTGGEAQALLGAFSFDEGRLTALRLIASKLPPLSDTGRKKVLSMLSFSSSRESAARMLRE
jgi:hypothetical protein